MKPKPFWSLNHFTVPLVRINASPGVVDGRSYDDPYIPTTYVRGYPRAVCGHHGHKIKRASTLPEEDRRPQSRSVAPIVPDFTHYDRVTFPPRQDPASLIFPPLRRLHPPPADSSRRPPG